MTQLDPDQPMNNGTTGAPKKMCPAAFFSVGPAITSYISSARLVMVGSPLRDLVGGGVKDNPQRRQSLNVCMEKQQLTNDLFHRAAPLPLSVEPSHSSILLLGLFPYQQRVPSTCFVVHNKPVFVSCLQKSAAELVMIENNMTFHRWALLVRVCWVAFPFSSGTNRM
jgi:hypothetical protein